MPTIIALDVSLSMSRPIPNQTTGTGGPGSSGSENVLTYHQLAIQGVNYILDYLSKHARLEFVSLVSAKVLRFDKLAALFTFTLRARE